MDGETDGLAVAELASQENARMESRIRKMMGNEPFDSESQLSLADALFDKGDDAEAIRVLQLLIYTEPTNFTAYDRLIDTCTRLGRRAEAAEIYRQWGDKLSQGAREPVTPADDRAVDMIVDKVAHYYAIRAPEYDQTSGYQKPGGAELIEDVRSAIKETVRGRDAIEIACGTGYWTAVAAETARSVLATDRNVELVQMVRNKMADSPHVRCQTADAYSLDGVEGPFTAAYAQFWWSHIPRAMIVSFLSALHSKLAPGAHVFFMDSLPYLIDGPRRVDADGNVIEPRVLLNGEKYEVIKNFPTEAELREALEGFATDLQYKAYEKGSLWTVSYRARAKA